jgi:hypothetical protein
MTTLEIGSKWSEKTGLEFFNEFVKYFPTSKDFTEWLKDKDLSMEEDENGHMDWYPEGELWEVGHLFGVELENDGTNLENYTDFFNELNEYDW